MKQRGLFIAGTDTDVGKTFVGGLLGGIFKQTDNLKKFHLGILKPVASGAKTDENMRLYSEDARTWMRLCAIPPEEEDKINPVCLPGDFSPKTAALRACIQINPEEMLAQIRNTVSTHDYTLIEGAGGITTALTVDYSLADLMKDAGCSALLIADARLGSINRCILTAEYARQQNIPLIGIIINNREGVAKELLVSNTEDIRFYTGVPVLAVVPLYTGADTVKDLLAWGRGQIDIDNIVQLWEEYYE